MVGGSVHVAHQVEDGGQRLRGVQVVVERRRISAYGIGGQHGDLRVRSRRQKLRVCMPPLEVAQPLHRVRRLQQAVEGEVELLAIRHRGQQQTDRRGLVAHQHQVAQGIEVAQRLRHLLPLNQQKAHMHPVARERSCRVSDSLCAISFSWCGNIRSSPPACRSKLSPRYSIAIVEHSMCQPGRPRPISVSHAASPSFGAFHSAKSRASSFSYSSASMRPPPSAMPAQILLAQLAVLRKLVDAEVPGAVLGLVGNALVRQPRMNAPSPECARWRARCAPAARSPRSPCLPERPARISRVVAE